MDTYGQLIGGEWTQAGEHTFETRDPAHEEVVLGVFPSAGAGDVARAVAAAGEAFPAWKATSAPARGAILFRAAELLGERLDEIAVTLTREEGKTLGEARGEVLRARDIVRFYAGEGWRPAGDVLPANAPQAMLWSRREPLGVVAVITPWNFPVAIPAWKIAPALAYGNAVVFKPASATPLTALRLVECFVDAGLPAGVLNFVTGPGATAGAALAADPGVAGLTFTGSHATGAAIYADAAAHFARVQLEMGGKNPTIVLDDADLDLAVKLTVTGGFGADRPELHGDEPRDRRGRYRRPFRGRFGGGGHRAQSRRRPGGGRAGGPSRERGAVGHRPRVHRDRPFGGRGARRRRRPRR